ncbi:MULTISPECIES: M24 family metallopeptidase [unclassified Rhizobium]|uniref:M24 family metallopeptidase n=1 Tax=unclassified Rhizobium TaxID=2613769 RepID=UPI001ADC6A7B|nr:MULTISPECIES: Xaa-Pro peptidase family protein [unclassified Rhizobium]MBO9101536.1 aminopeptidase P family protein [Rhizobium sp. L58/93]MBO9187529.1 aminopeptidase P family protein [Rhizobium sp. E27B/91]QXZ86684.1 aminopeptidase P family protein [Rhizobium sp. K1/93]QXZ93283.1 aminopeptidase P family protein [Rhizobium sp. K15/93]
MPDYAEFRGCEASFPESEFKARQDRARVAIAAAGHRALIVTTPENIFWLTGRQTAGYFAFQALVMPVEGEATLLVRQLELVGSIANTWLNDIVVYQDGEAPAAVLAEVLRERGIHRPAIELGGWFLPPVLADEISLRTGGNALIDGSGIIAPLRAVKSPAELAAIRLAATYAQAGIAAGIAACGAGTDENAIAAAMLDAATRAGSEAMAMEPLVSSGPRSGLPHMTWRRRRLEVGDPVFLELAGSHARYHAALMRLVWIGGPPVEARRMMDCSLHALEAALHEVRPGVPCSAAHEAAQRVIDDGGYTAAFRKRIGYSMGVAFAPDWGEGGMLSLFSGVDRIIEPGMVFHLPATLRSYGVWTVGASETVIVTEEGCEPLSTLSRDLTIR